jgi:hypothetical protein
MLNTAKVTRNSASVTEDREDPEHFGAVYLALPGRPGEVWHVPNGIGTELLGVPEQSALVQLSAFMAEGLAHVYFELPLGDPRHWSRNILELEARLAQFESEKEENVAKFCAQMAVTQLKATARTIAVFMVNDLVSPMVPASLKEEPSSARHGAQQQCTAQYIYIP